MIEWFSERMIIMNDFFKKNGVQIPFFVLSIALLCFYFYLIRYVVPTADDFSGMLSDKAIMETDGLGHFGTTFKQVYQNYLYNQGTWFSSFTFFLPLTYYSYGLWGLRVLVFVYDLLFFFSILFLLSTVLKTFDVKKALWPLFAILLFAGMNNASPKETLYWVNGAVVYTIPFAFAAISLSLFIMFLKRGKVLPLILACIFGFCSTGGVLMVAGLLNAVTFYILVTRLIQSKKFYVREWIYFLVVFGGALFNVLSPGNYTRHDAYTGDSALALTEIIANTFHIVNYRIYLLTVNGYLPLLIAFTVVMLLFVPFDGGKEKMFVNPIITVLLGYSCLLVAFFPVVLGYNMKVDTFVEIRQSFLFGFIICLAFMYVAGYTALWIRFRFLSRNPSKKAVTIGIVAVLLTLVINQAVVSSIYNAQLRDIEEATETAKADGTYYSDDFSNLMFEMKVYHPQYIFYAFKEFADQTIYNTYTDSYAMLSVIKNYPDLDIAFYNEMHKYEIIKDIAITYDPGWWINATIAAFYGKNTIKYVPVYRLDGTVAQ